MVLSPQNLFPDYLKRRDNAFSVFYALRNLKLRISDFLSPWPSIAVERASEYESYRIIMASIGRG